MDYELPPEINSGRMYTGLGSSSMLASAAAWQALSAQLHSAGAAFQAVITELTGAAWLGPSSMSMAMSAAPYVVWMIATAEQAQGAALAAEAAATAFEGARAGVAPPPLIAENRTQLATLIATNFMGFNTPAIGVTQAHYGQMWAQDTGVMYDFAGQAAGITGSLVPFTPALPNSDPIGLAAQTAALGDSAGQVAGQDAATIGGQASSAMPAGMDAESMLTMGPLLIETIPQTLQGFSSPFSSLGSGGLGQFSSLLSPFMSALSGGQGGLGASGISSVSSLSGPGLGGLGSAAAEVEATAGRAGSLGGLSVPATWTAGASSESSSTARAVTPIGAGGSAPGGAAPASGTGGTYGGAPMGAGAHGRGEGSDGSPRYGKPVKVVQRR